MSNTIVDDAKNKSSHLVDLDVIKSHQRLGTPSKHPDHDTLHIDSQIQRRCRPFQASRIPYPRAKSATPLHTSPQTQPQHPRNDHPNLKKSTSHIPQSSSHLTNPVNIRPRLRWHSRFRHRRRGTCRQKLRRIRPEHQVHHRILRRDSLYSHHCRIVLLLSVAQE